MASFAAPSFPTAAPLAPAKAPVDANIRVCLDFIKGRCTRPRCRFHHPEMGGYQQLSGAVHAQAGRQICEVWAMAGQCKFGAKCNKMHPVVLAQPAPQPAPAPLPVAVLPRSPVPVATPPPPTAVILQPQPANPAMAPSLVPRPAVPRRQRFPTLPPHLLLPAQVKPSTATPAPATPVPPVPLRPLHAASMVGLQGADSAPDAEAQTFAEFEGLAQSILKALETQEWEPPAASPTKPPLPRAAAPRGRSLSALFGMDRAFADVLRDLTLPSPC